MLNTALDMYKLTLSGIKKEATAVLTPTQWVSLINECYLNWIREKMEYVEINQKISDDLQPLQVVQILAPLQGNEFSYPPESLKLLCVQFKINYINNECGLTGVSEWLGAKPLKSDAIGALGHYSKPKDSRLYYLLKQDLVELVTGTQSTPNSMRIEFLTEPTAIELTPSDVPPQVRLLQRQELVDIAVRTYLERVKEERYQSNLNEEILKTGKK